MSKWQRAKLWWYEVTYCVWWRREHPPFKLSKEQMRGVRKLNKDLRRLSNV